MSRFTVVNLHEVDDSVGDRAPGIEGRFARKHLESRDLGISLWRYAPNLSSSVGHSHKQQEEVYVVLDGTLTLFVEGEPLEYVLSWAEFCGLRIAVEPGVFIPRRRTQH